MMRVERVCKMICIMALALLAACSAPKTASPAAIVPTDTQPAATATMPAAAPTAVETRPVQDVKASPTPPPAFNGLALAFDSDDLFAAAGVCTGCHANMVDDSGKDVSIDKMWRASMMANAARDPYWLAAVRSETLDAPGLREVIEDKCATCHLPMAATSIHAAGGQAALLDGGLLAEASAGHALGMDGVSCNLCHQIEAGNFGLLESFSGHYLIDFARAKGERLAYGPFEVDEASSRAMQGGSGFVPVQSAHLADSEMCATCHTLYTPYLDETDEIAGEFPEQTPYQEWLNSQYKASVSCQGCHMPRATGGVQLSILPGPKRSPFSQHSFVGGNVYLLRMLRTFGEGLGVTASSRNYDDAIATATKLLQSSTATVKLSGLRIENGRLTGQVRIESLAGHKFPTSYPSRRAWLHVTVRDAGGGILFESGAAQPDGLIAGNDNDADAAMFEPHYLTLSSPDQVQIYEAIMVNTEGQVTTKLLRGAAYIKDNRLLPLGFDKAAAAADVAVYGDALGDADFAAGGDALALEIDLGGASGPFTVQVELLYQSIAFRWAQNLAEYQNSAEIANFLGFYQSLPNLPILVAIAQSEVK